MSGDGGNSASVGHDIHQQRNMPVIDVGTIERQHSRQFLHKRGTSGFDTECLYNLPHVISRCPCCVDTWNSQHLTKSRTARIQVPLRATRIVLDSKFGAVWQLDKASAFGQESSVNTRDTTESQVVKKMALHAPKHDIVLQILILGIGLMDDSQTNDLLVCIVITEDDCQILRIFGLETLRNIIDLDFLVKKHLTIQANAQKPS